jgi:hypothetical protein
MTDVHAAAVWSSLIAAAEELVPLKAAAWRADRTSLVDAARASLTNRGEQHHALEVLTWMDPAVTLALIEDVVRVGTHSQRDVLLTRQVLGRLPRTMLASALRDVVEKFLVTGDDDVYRRLAELARHLGLAAVLDIIVSCALTSANPHIRDVGHDFLADCSPHAIPKG